MYQIPHPTNVPLEPKKKAPKKVHKKKVKKAKAKKVKKAKKAKKNIKHLEVEKDKVCYLLFFFALK